MKRIALSSLSLALLGLAGVAHAQSSVTLYGIIDESFQYVHNANGAGDNLYRMAASNLSGSRWGLKGSEDLGGGLKAIFQLENGFDPNNGSLGQGGRMFGRQAYVGLSGDTWGTVTFGRQYDPLVDMVQPLTADNYWGSPFATPGDVDNNDNSSRTNNSIKYVSPSFGGFQFEGMYALGGIAGATGSGQTWAGAATYNNGPFGIAAGYIRMDNINPNGPTGTPTSDGTYDGIINNGYSTAKSIGIASVAAQYVAGPFTLGLRYSNAQYKAGGFSVFDTTEKYNIGGGSVNYQLTPALLLGLGYTYMSATGDTSAHYHQVALGGDYSLSKRTDLYLVGTYQRASGSQRSEDGSTTLPAVASVADYGLAASGRSQGIVSLGIRHKF